MKTMKRFWTVVLFLAGSAALASAQVAEFGVGGGSSTLKDKGDIGSGYTLDNGWSLIFRITINNWSHFGNEFGYNYNRTHLLFSGADQGGMAIHQGFYDFLAYALPEGKRVRPFAAGGVHFSNFVPPGSSASYGQGNNKFGVNYGGGLKYRVGEKWMFRVDYRQFLTGKPFGLGASGKLFQNQISAGFSFVL